MQEDSIQLHLPLDVPGHLPVSRPYLTTTQAAALLGLKRHTVSTYVRNGLLQGVRVGVGAKAIRIHRSEIERFQAERHPIGWHTPSSHPSRRGRPLGTLEELFWAKVDIRGPAECWLWKPRARVGIGYGSFKTGPHRHQTTWRAHRLAWILSHGPIPDHLWVLHHCDVPACCNPAHLFTGTAQANSSDMVAKGRNHRGAANHQAKLTADQVIEMRRRHAAGGVTLLRLAEEHDVSPTTIGDIIRRRSWGWLA